MFDEGRRRLVARGAVAVALVGCAVCGGRSGLSARAEGQAGDCLVGWRAQGYSAALGQAADLPYESLVGEPWASAEIDDTPRSEARASLYYEGPVGEVVIGTAAKSVPENPFDARALWPAPGGAFGTSHDAHDDGPVQHSEAEAEPGKAVGDVRALGASEGQGSGGGALAHAEAAFNGSSMTGSDMSVAYGVDLGALHISLMRSLLRWSSDGTDANSSATYTVEFHGVSINGQPISSSDGDGFTFSSQSPSPGAEAHKQYSGELKQFTDALEKSGAGEYHFVINEGSMKVSGGAIDVNEVGAKFDFRPAPFSKAAVQGASWQFGRTEEHVTTSRGSCDAVEPLPTSSHTAPPSGPNLPPPQPPGGSSGSVRASVGTGHAAPGRAVAAISGRGSREDSASAGMQLRLRPLPSAEVVGRVLRAIEGRSGLGPHRLSAPPTEH